MSTATLNGIACTSVSVHLPAWGLWFADCSLDREAALSGRVDLLVADLTLRGAIVSGGSWQGRSSYRIVGGTGGWCKPLPPKAYVNDAGVKISTVLTDAATECGETIEGAPAGVVGLAFDRLSGPASAVLNLVCPQSWYVGEDGLTRFGRRSSYTVPSTVARTAVDTSGGYVELASDSIAKLLPGAIVDGATAVDVVHRLDGGKLRSTLWSSAFGPTTKRLLAWSKLIEQMRPFERYRGVWEYRVAFRSGDRLDLQAATSRFGLPDLRAVRVRPGVAGCKASVQLGSLVLVAFVNADPSRPCVVGFDEPESPGFAPDRLDLVGEDDPLLTAHVTSGRVVRYGDTIYLPTGAAAVPAPFKISPTELLPGTSLTVSRVRA